MTTRPSPPGDRAGSEHALSPATAARLRSLQFRIAGLISLLSLVVVCVFSVVVVRLDRELRDERLEADLLRETDLVARSLSFESGDLQPEDPTALLGDVLVGVWPAFDIFRLLDERDLWGQISQPTDDEIYERATNIFFELDADTQRGVLWSVGDPDNEDWEDLTARVVDQPPDQLVDEAYRRYVLESAEAAQLDLSPETAIYRSDWQELADETMIDAVFAVADDNVDDLFEVEDDGGYYLARGTVLRDGAEVRGAVVALIDPAESIAEHERFRNLVVVLALALVVGSAIAAWFVAARTLRPAQAALAQQERFLADAAHELRTPVAAIRATAESPPVGMRPETSGDGLRGDDPRLARIAAIAVEASRLTDDLMTLAQMDAERLTLRTEPTRLDLLVEAVLDGDQRFVVDADQVIADVDPSLLERAFSNVVRNALAHGSVTLDDPGHVSVRTTGIEVSDRGPGFPPGEGELLFERFRTASSSDGHGLGLPLARWIARAHGGDLTASPRPGGGARFTLRLPGRPDPGMSPTDPVVAE